MRFSHKNVARMREIHDKMTVDPQVAEEVKGFAMEARVLVLAGDWCGDCVTNLPPIARLAELNPKLQFRILDRDRHDDLMEHFLTNGARAIPKVIAATADFARIRLWGARPAACQAIMDANKGKLPKEEIIPMIREWYEKDQGQTTMKEVWGEIEALGR